jgi:hypothetical protein
MKKGRPRVYADALVLSSGDVADASSVPIDRQGDPLPLII